ncbi:hypothetical protein, partial [Streptomyces roseolus]
MEDHLPAADGHRRTADDHLPAAEGHQETADAHLPDGERHRWAADGHRWTAAEAARPEADRPGRADRTRRPGED